MFQGLSLRSRLGLVALVVLFGAASQGLRWWGDQRVGAAVAASARPGDIRMIASESCVYCQEARAWFNAHQVPFSECVVEREPSCAAQYQALMTPGTPLLVVRGTPIRGFDARSIADALASHVL